MKRYRWTHTRQGQFGSRDNDHKPRRADDSFDRCRSCGDPIHRVPVAAMSPVTASREEPKWVKVKGKADAKVHVCGQVSMPRPEPEVEGQVEAFTEEGAADLDELDEEDDGDHGPS